MLRLKRTQVQPIGVDIGFDSVKLLQLEVSGGQLAVVAAARQALPEELRGDPSQHIPMAIEIVRRLLRSGGFQGKQIVTALPREFVQVKNLRLPQMPANELAAAVEFEARNIFPFDTDKAQVRFLHAGEVRQGSDNREEVIVLAAKHSDVNDYVERLHRAGVVVESLDFEPAAIYRSIERFIRRREDEQEVNVLLDFGYRRSQVIIGRGHDISFFKPIDLGGQHLQEAVARKLGVTVDEAAALRRRLTESSENPADAGKNEPVRQVVFDATRSVIEELAREISLCLRYYSVTFRGHRPNRLRLMGGEACDPQIHTILSASLPVPVEVARPMQNTDTTHMRQTDRSGILCEWTTAFGLSLKRVNDYFGSREGKKRDPAAPRDDIKSQAEVIDLSRAIEASEPLAACSIEAHRASTRKAEEGARA